MAQITLLMIRTRFRNFHFPSTPKQNHDTPKMQSKSRIYFRMEEARRLRASTLAALDSATRLARRAWYSDWNLISICNSHRMESTYSSVLGLLRVTALQCDAVALVLEALRSDQTLDLGRLCVWLLALSLWLNLSSDNELTDL
jgi:hypothetical protein